MLVKKEDIMPMVLSTPLLHHDSHLTGFTSTTADAFHSMKFQINDCHWLLRVSLADKCDINVILHNADLSPTTFPL